MLSCEEAVFKKNSAFANLNKQRLIELYLDLIFKHLFHRSFLGKLDFPNFLNLMQHFHDEWIQEWCDRNGWTDLFMERYNHYWAFPPNCVMPEPIPQKVMRLIKSEKGLSHNEQKWLYFAVAISVTALLASYFILSPMPLMFAFGFDAVTAARMDCEV